MLGKIVDRVAWWGAAAWDAHYNNPVADDNFIRLLEQDRDLTGLWIDDPLTDVAKPEVLNKDLTYWHLSEEEALVEAGRIPNHMRYQHLWSMQFEILDRRLAEIRRRLPHPRVEIVLSIDSKNTHQTMVALAHELLLVRKKGTAQAVQDSKQKLKEFEGVKRSLTKQLSTVAGVEGQEHEAQRLGQQIQHQDSEIRGLERELTKQVEEKDLYREKKGGPLHQSRTKALVLELYRKYQEICDKYNVVFKPGPGLHIFRGGFVVDYAHSRHATWAVVTDPSHSLVKSTHGKMTAYQRNAGKKLRAMAGDAIERKVDAILEGPKSGKLYFRYQKIRNLPKQGNFDSEGYDRKDEVEGIYLGIIPPFEDQSNIGKYFSLEEPERTVASSKMLNTRKHDAFDRYNKGGVSGVMILTKLDTGIVYPEVTQYKYFADGSVLNPPQEYAAIAATSDEHIGSKEADAMNRRGMQEVIRTHATKPFQFRGKSTRVRYFFTGGDLHEATLARYDRRDLDQPNPDKLMPANIELFAEFAETVQRHNGDVAAALVELGKAKTTDAMGGYPQSMDTICRWGADYLETIFDILEPVSPAQIIIAGPRGNHADGALRTQGMSEYRQIITRLQSRGFKVYEGNVSSDRVCKQSDPEVRAAFASRGDARILVLEDFGRTVDGGQLQELQRVVIHHDPEGNGATGLINTTLSHEGDVGISGHTHEVYLVAYKLADNEFRVCVRLTTIQGTTATEIKYANVPRTPAGHLLLMPRPGDFGFIIIPSWLLHKFADDALNAEAEEELRKRKVKPDSALAEGGVGEADGGSHETKPE